MIHDQPLSSTSGPSFLASDCSCRTQRLVYRMRRGLGGALERVVGRCWGKCCWGWVWWAIIGPIFIRKWRLSRRMSRILRRDRCFLYFDCDMFFCDFILHPAFYSVPPPPCPPSLFLATSDRWPQLKPSNHKVSSYVWTLWSLKTWTYSWWNVNSVYFPIS